MTYTNLNKDTELLKNTKMKDDQLRDLPYKTEKHDHENILFSLNFDNDYYKKNYKSLNEKKVLSINTETMFGSVSTKISKTLLLLNPSAGIFISSTKTQLTSNATLTNNYTLKLKII